MSTVTRRKAATYEDLLAVPDHMVAEILDGDLFTFPRPSFRHARTASTLGGDLQSRFDHPPGGGDTPGGWWILDEPELHLREDIVVPDVAGWRRERVPLLPDAPWFDVAPDWVCEVLSPSTETVDRGRKLRIYAREEVSHLWLVNPVAKTLEVYRLGEAHWVLLRTFVGEDVVRAGPFEAVEFPMSRWWLPGA
ncbi:MAG TPA: Uma2 family endonuclease [Vicinamibacteria bacterium]|nr:Uma2 family endonuclease [Vicinamibacteria bacterium]